MSEGTTSATAAPRGRPLSPHLQVYRLPLTAKMSILHRATGVALSAGLLMLVAWVIAAANGQTSYDEMQACLSSPFGIFLLMGWSWSMFYHLCNGVRHLIWDLGYGFAIPAFNLSGQIALLVSTALTLVTWYYAFERAAQ